MRQLPRIALVAGTALALAAECSCYGASDGVIADTVTVDLQQAQCNWLASCEGVQRTSCPLEVAIPNVAPISGWNEPIVSMTAQTTDALRFEALLDSIRAGKIQVNMTALNQCVTAIQNRPCVSAATTVADHDLNVCDDAFLGTVPLGGHCISSAACQGGLVCTIPFADGGTPLNPGTCDGTCTALEPPHCVRDSDCSGDGCLNGFCVYDGSEGGLDEPCSEYTGCEAGSWCGASALGDVCGPGETCQADLDMGQACAFPTACDAFTETQEIFPWDGGFPAPLLTYEPCVDGGACTELADGGWSCEPQQVAPAFVGLAVGAPCSYSGNCPSGKCVPGGICSDGATCSPTSFTCVPLPTSGDCTADGFCGLGAWCNPSQSPPQCEAIPEAGASCSNNNDCMPAGAGLSQVALSYPVPLACQSGQCAPVLFECTP